MAINMGKEMSERDTTAIYNKTLLNVNNLYKCAFKLIKARHGVPSEHRTYKKQW